MDPLNVLVLALLALLVLGLVLDAVLASNRWWERAHRSFWLAVVTILVGGTVILAALRIAVGDFHGWWIAPNVVVTALIGYWLVAGAWERAKTPPSSRRSSISPKRADPRAN